MINIRNLVKRYQNIIAVNNLSLDIHENEVFGLLGPNGAGKTTTIHMLATLLKPTFGTASVNGYDIVNEPAKVRASIGIVFQAPSSDDILTGYENLKLHSLRYSVPRHIREKRISEVLELVGLTERKDDRVKQYSGGMRRRLEIARGLIHKPKVIFLDEPTLGLDPTSRELMWKYIKLLVREENVTIILTTHYMEEAQELSDRVGIIDHGELIALGTQDELTKQVGQTDTLILHVGENDDPETLASLLKELKGVQHAEVIGNSVAIVTPSAEEILASVVTKANERGIKIRSMEIREPNLEAVFLHLTGRALRD